MLKISLLFKKFIVDASFWHHVKSLNQVYLFGADTPYFSWESKNKLLFDFYLTDFSKFTFSELSTFIA